MNHPSRAGPSETYKSPREAEARKQSIDYLRLVTARYDRIASLPEARQAEALDRLHLEFSKLTRPYGEQGVALPLEVSVRDWYTHRITSEEIDVSRERLSRITDLLVMRGASGSPYVQLLEAMVSGY